MQHRQEGANN